MDAFLKCAKKKKIFSFSLSKNEPLANFTYIDHFSRKNQLIIKEAVDPTNVLWDNMHIKKKERY